MYYISTVSYRILRLFLFLVTSSCFAVLWLGPWCSWGKRQSQRQRHQHHRLQTQQDGGQGRTLRHVTPSALWTEYGYSSTSVISIVPLIRFQSPPFCATLPTANDKHPTQWHTAAILCQIGLCQVCLTIEKPPIWFNCVQTDALQRTVSFFFSSTEVW